MDVEEGLFNKALDVLFPKFLRALSYVLPAFILLTMGLPRYKKSWLRKLLVYGALAEAVISKIKPGPKGTLVIFLQYTVAANNIQSRLHRASFSIKGQWIAETQGALNGSRVGA